MKMNQKSFNTFLERVDALAKLESDKKPNQNIGQLTDDFFKGQHTDVAT